MKLIKLITAVVMSLGLMIAQPPQGGNHKAHRHAINGLIAIWRMI